MLHLHESGQIEAPVLLPPSRALSNGVDDARNTARALLALLIALSSLYAVYRLQPAALAFSALAMAAAVLLYFRRTINATEFGSISSLFKLGTTALFTIVAPGYYCATLMFANRTEVTYSDFNAFLLVLVPVINFALLMNSTNNFLQTSAKGLTIVSITLSVVAASCVYVAGQMDQSWYLSMATAYLLSAIGAVPYYLKAGKDKIKIEHLVAVLLILASFCCEFKQNLIANAVKKLASGNAAEQKAAVAFIDLTDSGDQILEPSSSNLFPSAVDYSTPDQRKSLFKKYYRQSGKINATANSILLKSSSYTSGYSQAKQLSAKSYITGSIDKRTLTAAFYWTVEIANSSSNQQEALATIKLPAGACVTRATLWINGVPQEAAFSAKRQAQEAYWSTASVRRDPLLISCDSPELVKIKAAPIEPLSKMKIRIGITAPLTLSTPATGYVASINLPSIESANFATSDTTVNLTGDIAANEQIATEKLGNTVFSTSFDPETKTILSRATHSKEPAVIAESVIRTESRPVERLLIVLDNSAVISDHIKEIKEIINQIPSSIEVAMVKATDEFKDSQSFAYPGYSSERSQILEQLNLCSWNGAPSNQSTLIKAIEQTDDEHAILWIHGSQIADGEILSQIECRPDRIIDCNLTGGLDELLDRNMTAAYPILAKRLKLSADQQAHQAFWKALHMGRPSYEIHFDKIADSPSGSSIATSHLTEAQTNRINCLWANQEILTLVNQNIRAAEELGEAYRVVSPATGAVVLGTQEQYALYNLHRNQQKVVSLSLKSNNDKLIPLHVDSFDSGGPFLQGATSGTIAPRATQMVQGVNTAGTVTVNQLAAVQSLASLLTGACLLLSAIGIVWQFFGAVKADSVIQRNTSIIAATLLLILSVGLPALVAQLMGSL